jgi:riboflavin kinase/FMN adenylyltransferase
MAAGDCSILTELMNNNATVVPLLSTIDTGTNSDNVIVSSTYIRALLAQGNIEKANELLCENYTIYENVLHGKALGRTIGIPTINQSPMSKKIILKNGIYATICTVDGFKYYGVTNVGTRPTVEDNGAKNIETFIIDFSDDCYDKQVKTEFVARIRDEKKFDDLDALKAQIKQDIRTAKEILIKK